MPKLLAVFIYCLIASIFIEVSVAATGDAALFTAEEQQWIKDHPVIKVGGEMDWAPFDFVNQYGDYDGLVNEFLKLIEKKSGLKLVVETGYTWDELVTRFKNNEYDLLPATYYSKERTKYGIYTEPYLKLKEFVYIRDDNKAINSFYDLADKTIAMPKGYTHIGKLKEILPDATILETDNILGAINAVLNKQAEALIEGQAVMNYTLKQNMITGLRGIAQEAFVPKKLHILVRKDAPLLQQIIQKSLNAISKEERKVIVDEYMGFTGKTNSERKVDLTADEYHYLKNKKTIKMCVDPDWLPFERINERGKHEGMAANYIQMFSDWIGSPINLVKTDNWQQSMEFGRTRQCDILSAAAKTSNRRKYWSFTEPYMVFPNVIATLNEQGFIKDIQDVIDKPFGVVKGFAIIEILRNKYPEIKLIEVENVSDGLIKVSKGELFGFIDTIASIGYTIHQENFLHLKIAGEVGAELKLAIAVRNDEEQLLVILNKAIKQLARQDKNEVDSQWIAIKFDKEFDYTLLWQVLAVAILIILIIAFWARKLNVAKRQIQLLNEELRTSGERLNFALEGSNDGLWDWNIKSGEVYLSPRWEKMLGYEPGELVLHSDSLIKMINPEQRNEVRQTIDRHLRGENSFYNTEYQMRSKTGEWVWIETRGKVVERGNFGTPIRCVGTHTDISEKKKLQEALLKQLEMIENDQRFLNTVLDSQNQIIIITNGNKIQKANRSFLNFFAVENLKEFTNKYDCISDVFTTSAPKGYLQKQMNDDTWLHYLLANPERTHQVLIEKKGDYCIFSASAVNLNQKGKDLFLAVFSDITELEESKKQITDSIEYSSLIQHALIPYDELFSRNFDQHFAIWQPRDVVGGDIYLFEELRNENECLLMMIDCTGHGVPGAFVTMLVKAIERQVIGEINSSKQEVSTAFILNVFNKSIKTLLRQQEDDSISNAGCDGGILYINYTDKIARYSGAYTPLFIIQNDELKMIEGDRQSIGYKKSDINFQFTEHTFSIEKETRLYLTTDGYLDQIGGEKRFRFGKRRFKRLVEENFKLPMEDQQDKFLEHMRLYQGKEDAIDDITLIGLKLKNNQNKK